MNDLTQSLAAIFERDLTKLEEEIKLYQSEESLWIVAGAIKNSGGNLSLHVCGGLRYFVGTVLGHTNYERNRDYEFSARGVLKKDLRAEIQATKEDVKATLNKLDVLTLEKEYPLQVFGYAMTTTFFLIHLASHLSYHLGQVNYHRRLL
ncbi:MAG: DinB family protein [Cyclobacteriaceae bacterium]|jgi:uncharacterized damage-inducible protein DinB|nr:DinB family protein [Cyclobacteriaceae bacterium]MDH4296906.1 DinB family protein [Cyclobacteriaceae bacterium]MDH5249301.1 DinB family protein [Cyclobacteriaceae bacterium]